MKIPKTVAGRVAMYMRPLDTPERRARYLAGDFYKSAAVKDLNRRYRWDLFWSASGVFNGKHGQGLATWMAAEMNSLGVEGELSNEHIDTMLRKIVHDLQETT